MKIMHSVFSSCDWPEKRESQIPWWLATFAALVAFALEKKSGSRINQGYIL
jgi:hypothetical protein